jgi:hypothetical protein
MNGGRNSSVHMKACAMGEDGAKRRPQPGGRQAALTE